MSMQSPSSSIGTATGGRAVGDGRVYEGKSCCSRACVDEFDVVGIACSARRQDSVEGWGPRRLLQGICRRRASCGHSLCGWSGPAAHSLVCFCPCSLGRETARSRSEEHTSELQSPDHLVCRPLLEKKTSR